MQTDGEVTCVLARGRVERRRQRTTALPSRRRTQTSRHGCWPSTSATCSPASSPSSARIFNTTLSSIVDFAYIFDRDGRFRTRIKRCSICGDRRWRMRSGRTSSTWRYPAELAAKLQRQIQHVFDSGEIVRDDDAVHEPVGRGRLLRIHLHARAQGRPYD